MQPLPVPVPAAADPGTSPNTEPPTNVWTRVFMVVTVIFCTVLFACWLVYVVLIACVEPLAMFAPRRGPTITTEWEEQIQLQTEPLPNGYRFSLYPLYTTVTPRRALVVYHGNGGCAMQSILCFVRLLYGHKEENKIHLTDKDHDDPVDIIVYEYPGFGHRFGQKTKKQHEFLSEALAFTRYVMRLTQTTSSGSRVHAQTVNPKRRVESMYTSVVLVGTSLGTGVVTYIMARLAQPKANPSSTPKSTTATQETQEGEEMANEEPPPTPDEQLLPRIAKIVLVTPYASMRETVNHQTWGLLGWISSWHALNNAKHLNELKHHPQADAVQKVLVFAEDDQILPVDKHAYRLTPYANQTYVLTKTDHNSWFNRYFVSFWRNVLLN